VSVSDEAFAAITAINNGRRWDKCCEQLEKAHGKTSVKVVNKEPSNGGNSKTLYLSEREHPELTAKWTGKKSGSNQDNGWAREGIDIYWKLCDTLKTARNTEQSKKLEKATLDELRKIHNFEGVVHDMDGRANQQDSAREKVITDAVTNSEFYKALQANNSDDDSELEDEFQQDEAGAQNGQATRTHTECPEQHNQRMYKDNTSILQQHEYDEQDHSDLEDYSSDMQVHEDAGLGVLASTATVNSVSEEAVEPDSSVAKRKANRVNHRRVAPKRGGKYAKRY